MLIVLDQFEQWLHARDEVQSTELIQALRQCDGGNVQCLLMVRDDFWLPVSRFMRALEVLLLEGENIALVDVFDLDHAEKILTAFGQAFGRLSENADRITPGQREFLKHSIQELAEDGKVNCVRLALFAEMMKGKSWTPSVLKDVGGIEGIGETYLEETFHSTTAAPNHRYHQKAALRSAQVPASGFGDEH